MGRGSGYIGELGALRKKLDPIVKTNGWVTADNRIDSTFIRWFKQHQNLPIEEILELFNNSRFSGAKPRLSPVERLKREIYAIAKSNGWKNKAGVPNQLRRWFEAHQHLTREEIMTEFAKTDFSHPKSTGSSPWELLVSEITPIVKSNGWKNREGYCHGSFHRWQNAVKHLPVEEVRKLFFKSRFAKKKPVGLSNDHKILKAELNKRSMDNGWTSHSKSVYFPFTQWFKSNSDLDADEIRRLFFTTKFSKPHPKLYKDPQWLAEQIQPIKAELAKAFEPWAGYDFSNDFEASCHRLFDDLQAVTNDERLTQVLVNQYMANTKRDSFGANENEEGGN